MDEDEVIRRILKLKRERVIRQISAIFDSKALGYRSSLAAFKVEPSKIDEVAEVVNAHTGVSHNYRRDHEYNLWFTLTVPPGKDLQDEVDELARKGNAQSARLFPTLRLFKIGVAFDMLSDEASCRSTVEEQKAHDTEEDELNDEDIAFARELQNDLDVVPRPFEPMARRLGVEEDEVLEHAIEFIQKGVMRRYAAVLRHRRAGFSANAMGAWNVPEEMVEEIGRKMAENPAVSHCYQRPTYPDWPYSIFTMIHGKSTEECESIARQLSSETGITDYVLLYSSKEYKKERVRYFNDK